jgi:general secretion pathway protein J
MTAKPTPANLNGEAGFTLIEMMIAVVLMGFVLAALGTVTSQWLPNWNHGMMRVQRAERFAFGINRIVGDLSVAEAVPASNTVKTPLFDGSEQSVTFVRTTVGPNSHPGLEVIKLQEVADASGPAFVRAHTGYMPIVAGTQWQFADPLVLIRAPYRVTLSYSGDDGSWQPVWHDALQLPRRIRIAVRDGITQQILAVSTAAVVHIDTPAECAKENNVNQCLARIAQKAAPNANPPQAEAGTR